MNQREKDALDRYITGNYGEDQFKNMNPNNWIIVIRLQELPEDADQDTINTLLQAILDSNGVVPYQILAIKREE